MTFSEKMSDCFWLIAEWQRASGCLPIWWR